MWKISYKSTKNYLKNKTKYWRHITSVLFLTLLFIGAAHYIFYIITTQDKILLTSRSAINSFFDTNIFAHDLWIEAYGLEQKCLEKRQIEKFMIYKTDYGKMLTIQREFASEEVKEKVDAIYPIISHLDNEDIPYYYLTSILSVQDVTDLPYGVKDGSRANQKLTENMLIEKDINIIDLGAEESIKVIPKEKLFYRTDHHWTLETCFTAYQEIINTLEDDLGWDLNAKKTGDKRNYSEYRLKDSFLGSYGVKVGKYYAGKDDFVVFIPDFSTNMLFQSYNANGELQLEKTGDFYQALLDMEILENPDYNNKYNAFLNTAYIESHVINYNAPNSFKCLIISHSYGRPLTMYLTLNFSEVVNLDPQKGRFDGNYIDYINTYKPDVVLFLVESEGEIAGEYREDK